MPRIPASVRVSRGLCMAWRTHHAICPAAIEVSQLPKPREKRKPGRPLTADEPKLRVEVWITPTAKERAREIGQGNVSRGVEAAVRAAGKERKV